MSTDVCSLSLLGGVWSGGGGGGGGREYLGTIINHDTTVISDPLSSLIWLTVNFKAETQSYSICVCLCVCVYFELPGNIVSALNIEMMQPVLLCLSKLTCIFRKNVGHFGLD